MITPSSDDDADRIVPATPGPTPADPARDDAEIEADAAATARLEELERLQALVVATTAHELRTPLTVLRVHADLLRQTGSDLGPDERRALEEICCSVTRLQDVSDQLVDDLREGAGGAEEALRRWLGVEPDAPRA